MKRVPQAEQCPEKKRYGSKAEAQAACAHLGASACKAGRVTVRPYLCRLCLGWHVGGLHGRSRRPKTKRRRHG